jgi:carbamoyltransferase
VKILGLSAFYHDAAAALVVDGKIVAAAQEERFTRRKHDPAFPRHASRFCLDFAALKPAELDHVVFYDKPLLKFERLLETYLAFAPKGFASFASFLPVWMKDKLFHKNTLVRELEQSLQHDVDWREKLLFSEHHVSHAASAFFASPFETAAVLTLDGVGEWTTTSLAIGNGSNLAMIKEIRFPHSLGLLYSAFTSYTGFRVNSGEYKLMGLAPYGEPRYARLIKDRLIDIKADGSFRLNLAYFDYCTGASMTHQRFHDLFGAAPRQPESPITQLQMDLAASIQAVTEEVLIKLVRSALRETGERNLCLAGGVALNSVANGKLLREPQLDRLWIQPAAGDAGGAVGAALAAYHLHGHKPRRCDGSRDAMNGTYLGPEYSQHDIETRLKAAGAAFAVLGDHDLIEACAKSLERGEAVGWHQGRMEFGPRALGNRSILADPRSPATQKRLNLKIKFRESFRPFAPAVLREHVGDWFDYDGDSPYMALVVPINDKQRVAPSETRQLCGLEKLNVTRSTIPAVTHVDGSARIQTVDADTNPRFHALIRRFAEITGYPLLVNTSFNVRGEPIVCSPEDSFRCFMGTECETLAIGNCLLRKDDQKPNLRRRYDNTFEAD